MEIYIGKNFDYNSGGRGEFHDQGSSNVKRFILEVS
jgi:hypothetical protein